MELHGVQIDETRIAAFCKAHGVRRLSLFGSILGSAFRPDSDVDVLIEFFPDREPGMVAFGAMILELEAIMGRTVDLRTPNDLSRYFRRNVVSNARVLHAA